MSRAQDLLNFKAIPATTETGLTLSIIIIILIIMYWIDSITEQWQNFVHHSKNFDKYNIITRDNARYLS